MSANCVSTAASRAPVNMDWVRLCHRLRSTQTAHVLGTPALGLGAWLQSGDYEKELFGGEPETTNNRMELMAAIKALEALKRKPSTVELYTDSVYVRDGITKWIHNWKKNGWRTAAKSQ